MTGRYGYDSSSDDSEDDYYSGGIPKGIYINMELFSGNEDSDNYDNSDKSDNSDNVSASQSPTFKTRYDRHLQSHRFLEDHSRRHDTEHDQLDAPQNNTTGAPQNNTTGAPQNNTTDAPQNNTTNVCGEPFEVLDITEDTEIQGSASAPILIERASGTIPRGQASTSATSVNNKRRHPISPSPPLVSHQRPPVAKSPAFQQSRSSHLLDSSLSPRKTHQIQRWVTDLSSPSGEHTHQEHEPRFAPLSSRHARPQASFTGHEVSRAGPYSISSSISPQQRNVHSLSTDSSFAQSPVVQAPLSPFRSRAGSSSQGLAGAPFFAAPDTILARMEQRRIDLQDIHEATEEWKILYEQLPLGTIPSPEQCRDAPPSLKLLERVPNPKSMRKNSPLGHFYESISVEEFQCQFMEDSGRICGKTYTKKGGSRARSNHLTRAHSDTLDALKEFRSRQCMAQGIELPMEQEGEEISSAPKKPLQDEQAKFEDYLLKLATSDGGGVNVIASDTFRSMIGILNPFYEVPDIDSLRNKLDTAVQEKMGDIKTYIHQHVHHGAITMGGWEGPDQKRFLAIMFHFIAPQYKMHSVVIGLERIRSKQSADRIPKKLLDVIDQWDLGGKLMCGTTDQGADMKKPMEPYEGHTKTSWIPCLSNKMELCVNKALECSPGANKIMDRCQAISIFFRNFPNAMDALYKEQDTLYSRRLKLLIASITRCNSYYTMAGRIFEVIGAIEATYNQMKAGTADEGAKFAKEAPRMLDSQEIEALGEILKVLKPMVEFTYWVDQVNNPTISQIYHRIYTMRSVFDSLATEPAQELSQHLDRLIKDSWPLEGIPDVVLTAIYLNPACASLTIFDQIIVEDHQTLRAKAKNLTKEALISFFKTGGSTRGDMLHEGLDPPLHNITALYVVEAYDIKVKMCPKDFEHYRDAPETYWKSLVDSDPSGSLATVSRSYLCIQATSSGSGFSKGKLVLSASRTNPFDRDFCNTIFYNNVASFLQQ